MEMRESLVLIAQKWREANQEYKGGVVLVWQDAAYGWKDKLRDPAHEKPGAFAVDSDGHVFIAEGGNEYDGAKFWVAFSESGLSPADKIIDEVMAMSDEEVRAELVAQGIDPDAVVDRLNAFVKKLGDKALLNNDIGHTE